MNFLGTVLSTAGQVEMEDLKENITDIIQKISLFKLDVKKKIEDKYTNIHVLLSDEAIDMVDDANKLSDQMDNLLNRIEKQKKTALQDSVGELESLSVSLQEANLSLFYVGDLLTVDSDLKAAWKYQNDGKYFEAAKKLKNVGTKLKEADIELDMLIFLEEEKVLIQEQFLYDMTEIWKSGLKWEEACIDKDVMKVSLKVDIKNMDNMKEMVKALNYFGHLNYYLKKFANRIQKYMLATVIIKKCKTEVIESCSLAILEVQPEASDSKPLYTDVFLNITKILGFLHSFLNIKVEDEITFLSKIADVISEEFCECLIRECLTDAIPSHSSHLGAYDVVAEAIKNFQAYLEEIEFLQNTNTSILEYACNVDVLFANKICQIILGRAREIMKKDLHDCIEVGPLACQIQLSEKQTEVKVFDNLNPEFKISDNIFQFPKCHISKSTMELMDLVYEVLDEAAHSRDICAVRLFCTARNIFELYPAVVPTYHKLLLDTIPQQVALLHNNCMYLAHRLVTLGHDFKNRLPEVLKSDLTTFIDQVDMLRQLGANSFLKFMQSYRKQILDILRDSGLATLGEDPTVQPSIEKSIRQCLRQLELLNAVWKNTLPEVNYSKALGCLLNALIEELIIRVTTVEDIPAATAIHLVTVFGVVIDRAPQVFHDPREVYRYVKKWQKFKELILILGASLRDIDDRWADGKGPLAHEFSPDEIKQMVRALFQNTERRAAILARIK